MVKLTLQREGHVLASPSAQRALLERQAHLPSFAHQVSEATGDQLRTCGIDVLQVNVGRVCNQTCTHCHVDAGPDRKESMTGEVADACLRFLDRAGVGTLDITGGAPEMNPHFRYLVQGARQLGCRVLDRCNLTILLAPGYEDMAEFLADHQVDMIASLPCYLEENVDRQRGDRVFRRSITALQRLNALGYGMPGSPLVLSLVYNPLGPSLPPDQAELESQYRQELLRRYGIQFTNLYTITNMPISRFLVDLVERGQFDEYLHQLVQAFNPSTIDGLMCRHMLSVDWQGHLFDCDFNQMLDLPIRGGPKRIQDCTDEQLEQLMHRPIVTGRHCYGCTAGCGSSCQGSLTSSSPS
ncbi:MAG: radical SAM/Cys-rich domain protein [Pirellulaceae bacterium]|nr:MAG: radical SAM/Cys-rich domain protein [Pirellulaceae bacterium]